MNVLSQALVSSAVALGALFGAEIKEKDDPTGGVGVGVSAGATIQCFMCADGI